jgi:hypothetical protein
MYSVQGQYEYERDFGYIESIDVNCCCYYYFPRYILMM